MKKITEEELKSLSITVKPRVRRTRKLGDVLEQLREGLWKPFDPPRGPCRREYEDHCKGLLTARKRGSTTAFDLGWLPTDLVMTEVTDCIVRRGLDKPGCTYYSLTIPHRLRHSFNARMGVIKLRDLMKVEKNPLVELRDAGSHGIDLVHQIHPDHLDEVFPSTHELSFIFGPKPEEMWDDNNEMQVLTEDDIEILHTWHPGPILSRGSSELTLDSMIKLEVLKGV